MFKLKKSLSFTTGTGQKVKHLFVKKLNSTASKFWETTNKITAFQQYKCNSWIEDILKRFNLIFFSYNSFKNLNLLSYN